MLVYFAAKAFAVDLAYWTPTYGIVGYIASLGVHFVSKGFVDWTFFVQGRHPNEAGGVGFCWSLVSTVVIGFASATIIDEFQGSFEKATLMNVMIGCCIGLIVSFAVPLCAIDQKYLSTFISTKTGTTFIQEYITKKKEDEKKIENFENNENKWKPYIGDETKAWVGENLQRWINEKPKWFTDYRKSTIKDWAVEDNALLKKLRS